MLDLFDDKVVSVDYNRDQGFLDGMGIDLADDNANGDEAATGTYSGRRLRDRRQRGVAGRRGRRPHRDGDAALEEPRHQRRLHDQRAGRLRRLPGAQGRGQDRRTSSSSRSTAAAPASTQVEDGIIGATSQQYPVKMAELGVAGDRRPRRDRRPSPRSPRASTSSTPASRSSPTSPPTASTRSTPPRPPRSAGADAQHRRRGGATRRGCRQPAPSVASTGSPATTRQRRITVSQHHDRAAHRRRLDLAERVPRPHARRSAGSAASCTATRRSARPSCSCIAVIVFGLHQRPLPRSRPTSRSSPSRSRSSARSPSPRRSSSSPPASTSRSAR